MAEGASFSSREENHDFDNRRIVFRVYLVNSSQLQAPLRVVGGGPNGLRRKELPI